jgi:hypothetical protein
VTDRVRSPGVGMSLDYDPDEPEAPGCDGYCWTGRAIFGGLAVGGFFLGMAIAWAARELLTRE